jgi:flagellar protein FlaG
LSEFIPVSQNSEKQVDLNSLDNHKVSYMVNQEKDELVIRIVDKKSGEVVRQIPGEEFLRLTSRIAEFNNKIWGCTR